VGSSPVLLRIESISFFSDGYQYFTWQLSHTPASSLMSRPAVAASCLPAAVAI
jgi:hypothetical protein